MFEVLSPEKLMEIAKVPPEDYGAPPYWWLRANQRVAKASLKDALRQFMEWIEANTFGYDGNRVLIGGSIQYLKDQLEEKP